MYHKIVNKFDVDCLEASITKGRLMNDIPVELKEEVMRAIRGTVSILDEYYGETRHPDSDLGGYTILLPTLQDTELFYDNIIKHYNLNIEYAESVDVLADSGNIKFIQQTYILSSDFGIILVLPLPEE
jgi:hypothetical protein